MPVFSQLPGVGTTEMRQAQIANEGFGSLARIRGNGEFWRYPLSDEQRAQIIAGLEANEYLDDAPKMVPPQKYFDDHAAFLAEKDRGIARIFPFREDCQFRIVVSAEQLEKCAGMPLFRSGGSFYSFRNRTNLQTGENFSDIQLIGGRFAAGSGYSFGIIREISTEEFETLTRHSPEVKEIRNVKTPRKLSVLTELKTRVERGEIAGIASSAAAKTGGAYLIRSVAFRYRRVHGIDKRTDLTVVFKVAGIEEDGSFIIVWRKIKESDPAFLKLEK